MRTTSNRREKILSMLAECSGPLSATAIAQACSVSRQIIVGDIALLRAGGISITATPRGYILEKPDEKQYIECSIVCVHDEAGMAQEMYTVVDLGGALIDVTVEHSVYGQICAPLHVFSRADVDDFLDRVHHSGARPLCDLTGGIHLHRLRCPDETVQERVLKALGERGFLLRREEETGE